MSDTSIAPPDKTSLTRDAQSWASRARSFTITDAESCRNASYLLRSIKGVRGDIQRWFEPHIEAAMETKRKAEAARKALVDERDRLEAPLVDAEATIKRTLLAWERAQEEARLAEERRLQAEAQARAEALTLAAAAELEREAIKASDAEMLTEAHAILEQPIVAPVVSVKPMTPKVQGVVYRDLWKAHPDIDVKALAVAVASGKAPTNFLIPNMTAINAFARATVGAQDVPGVRFFNDRQIAARE